MNITSALVPSAIRGKPMTSYFWCYQNKIICNSMNINRENFLYAVWNWAVNSNENPRKNQKAYRQHRNYICMHRKYINGITKKIKSGGNRFLKILLVDILLIYRCINAQKWICIFFYMCFIILEAILEFQFSIFGAVS